MSPARACLFCFCPISEPDGPPTEKLVKYVDDWTISFSWSAPHPDLHNGIIIYYDVCIREYGPDFSCVRSEQVPESEENSYAFGGLKPSSEYAVTIKAATIIGPGPPAFIQKTAGKTQNLRLRSNDCFQDYTTEYKHTEDYLKRKTIEKYVRCFVDWPPCS